MHSLRVGWKNLFSSCAVVSVFYSGGKQVLVLHTTMYLDYHTVVVLCQFFWFWQEIAFGVTYILSVQYSCAVVSFLLLWREKKICTNFLIQSKFSSFFGSGGKQFLMLRTYIVYNTVVRLCQFFVVVGKVILYEYLTVTIVSQKHREFSL